MLFVVLFVVLVFQVTNNFGLRICLEVYEQVCQTAAVDCISAILRLMIVVVVVVMWEGGAPGY
jgi:hypothetical protein